MPHVEELNSLTITRLPCGPIPCSDLPPARDARLGREELVAGIAKLPCLGLCDRTGPNHGEVTQKHVQELGYLVEGGAPQEMSQARNTRVVIDLLLTEPLGHLGLVEVALGVLVGVGVHGPELEDANRPAAQPHALLAEDGPPGGVQADGDADEGDGDGAHNARDAGEGDVEGALGDAVPKPSPPGRGDARVGRRGDEGAGLRRHVLLATLCFFS